EPGAAPLLSEGFDPFNPDAGRLTLAQNAYASQDPRFTMTDGGGGRDRLQLSLPGEALPINEKLRLIQILDKFGYPDTAADYRASLASQLAAITDQSPAEDARLARYAETSFAMPPQAPSEAGLLTFTSNNPALTQPVTDPVNRLKEETLAFFVRRGAQAPEGSLAYRFYGTGYALVGALAPETVPEFMAGAALGPVGSKVGGLGIKQLNRLPVLGADVGEGIAQGIQGSAKYLRDLGVPDWKITPRPFEYGTLNANPLPLSFGRVEANSAAKVVKPGEFSIVDWTGYPAGVPQPTGPFRLLEGAEYNAARDAANSTNRTLRKDWNLVGEPVDIHEIQPVKFGGSPTDTANKIILDRSIHGQQVTPWWNSLQKTLKGK
ncbi:hypothetical protein, partial [Parvibium lacunae]|uniref:hypothetical protein n=1 Tax=Parvibium lacunae TaxID=1888893 RepID=UPI00195FE70F